MNACSVFRDVCNPLTKDYTYKDIYPDEWSWEVSVDKEAWIAHRGERISLDEASRRSVDNPEAVKCIEKFKAAKRQFERYWAPLWRRHGLSR